MIKLKTQDIKPLLSKVIKASGNNALLPITTMLGIKVQDNQLVLSCTDGTNLFEGYLKAESAENINITISAELFSKLIEKSTTENIEIELVDNSLKVKSNGIYTLPLISDEDGLVEFKVINTENIELKETLKSEDIKSVYELNKASLAKTFEDPHLTGYYIGGVAITSDRDTICFNSRKLFNKDLLLPPTSVYLLSLFDDQEIKANLDGEYLVFKGKDLILQTRELEGKENFPINELKDYLNLKLQNTIKINRDKLVELLDRLFLFIDPYDANCAYLQFNKDGLKVFNKKEASNETIKYEKELDTEPTNDDGKSCFYLADIVQLKEQLSSMKYEIITLDFGSENAIILKEEKLTKVIALLEEN